MHSTHVWAVWTPRRWRGWGSPPGSRRGSSSWRCRWWGGRSGGRCSPGQRGSRPGSQSRRGYSENIFVLSLKIYWCMKKICCKNIFIKKTYFVKYFYYFEIIFIKSWNSHISPAPPSPCCRSCWPPCWSPGPGGRARPRASPAGTGGPAAAGSSRWSCSAWAGCTAAPPWTRNGFLGCSCPVYRVVSEMSQSTVYRSTRTPINSLWSTLQILFFLGCSTASFPQFSCGTFSRQSVSFL